MKGLVEVVIIVAIIIASTIIVVSSVTSVTSGTKNLLDFNEDRRTMTAVDNAVREVFQESGGSSRAIDVGIRSGVFVADGADDTLKVILANDVLEKGTFLTEGGIELFRGPFLYTYERNDHGFPELVLENDALRFAVRKMGNETTDVPVSMDTIATELTDKRTNTTIVPQLGAEKSGSAATSGHTELSGGGQRGTITITTDAYTLRISLSAGHEFLDLEIT